MGTVSEGSVTRRGLAERIYRTAKITDDRGYNLSLERISSQLIGGPEDPAKVFDAASSDPRFVIRDGFIGIDGRLRLPECHDRVITDGRLGDDYRRISNEFSAELSSSCPDVKMVMVGGSLASNGLCQGEDIDFDIVTNDGSKYYAYLKALILGSKYSIRYRKLAAERYLGIVPKLICVNVVWEVSQVMPFVRRDDQIAYEVMNSQVLSGQGFFNDMVRANPWITETFPQTNVTDESGGPVRGNEGHRLRERLSRLAVFALFRLVRLSRSFDRRRRERMDRAERVKTPYGIFDVPSGGRG